MPKTAVSAAQNVDLVVVLRPVDCQAFDDFLATAGDDPGLPVDLHGELEDGVGQIPLLLSDGAGSQLLLDNLAFACQNLPTDGPQY